MKVDPDAAGFDAARLERITDHIQSRYIDPQKIAGCQIAVARHGEVGYHRSFGSMDLERDKPMQDDTIFRIYSMTKPIAGVALMKLYERGDFQLSDPVTRWIPEWKGLKVQTKDGLVDQDRPMSVKDCLMHMTGLGWGDADRSNMDDFIGAMTKLRGGRDGTLQTMVENLARVVVGGGLVALRLFTPPVEPAYIQRSAGGWSRPAGTARSRPAAAGSGAAPCCPVRPGCRRAGRAATPDPRWRSCGRRRDPPRPPPRPVPPGGGSTRW